MVYRNGEPIITTVQIQSVNLTWDEYQALPSTKLTDGVYYNITDWEQSTLDIVNVLTGENIALQARISELENANTYSTDEVRIGTYMGKPLYRKAIELSCSGVNVEYQQSIADMNIKVGYIANGSYSYGADSSGNVTAQPLLPWETGGRFRVCFINNFTKIVYACSNLNNSRNAMIILEYTKNTD